VLFRSAASLQVGDSRAVAPASPPGASADQVRQPCRGERWRFVKGLLLLLVVVFLWVFSSVLTQFLYDAPDVDYKKPTALTTISCASASFFLLPHAISYMACRQSNGHHDASNGDRLPWPILLLISANWFVCQWTFNLSLQRTSLATNTILSSSSTVWSYLFTFAFRRGHCSLLGLVCVICAMSGVVFAVLGQETQLDPNAPVDTVSGEALAVVSAIAYGHFSNALAVHVKPSQVDFLWGCVGLLCLAFGSCLMTLGQITGLEPFEMPSIEALLIMLLNAFLGTSISDYIWARAVLLTTPLVATVALNLTIPVSFVTDVVILRQHAFTWMAPLGAVMVCAGVVAGAVEEAGAADPDNGM